MTTVSTQNEAATRRIGLGPALLSAFEDPQYLLNEDPHVIQRRPTLASAAADWSEILGQLLRPFIEFFRGASTNS